jgi:hypothetical protein
MDYPAALGCNNATGTRLTEIKQHDGQPKEDNRTKSRTRIHSKQSNNPQQAREINPQLINSKRKPDPQSMKSKSN